jgi:hypothetical protein
LKCLEVAIQPPLLREKAYQRLKARCEMQPHPTTTWARLVTPTGGASGSSRWQAGEGQRLLLPLRYTNSSLAQINGRPLLMSDYSGRVDSRSKREHNSAAISGTGSGTDISSAYLRSITLNP